MVEKRAEKRSPIELAASYGIGDDPRPEREAKIYNVSRDGFCFTSNTELKEGQNVQLVIDLDTKEDVIITAKVIWAKKNENNDKYTIGVQILEKEDPEFARFIDFYKNIV